MFLSLNISFILQWLDYKNYQKKILQVKVKMQMIWKEEKVFFRIFLFQKTTFLHEIPSSVIFVIQFFKRVITCFLNKQNQQNVLMVLTSSLRVIEAFWMQFWADGVKVGTGMTLQTQQSQPILVNMVEHTFKNKVIHFQLKCQLNFCRLFHLVLVLVLVLILVMARLIII